LREKFGPLPCPVDYLCAPQYLKLAWTNERYRRTSSCPNTSNKLKRIDLLLPRNTNTESHDPRSVNESSIRKTTTLVTTYRGKVGTKGEKKKSSSGPFPDELGPIRI